MRSKSLGLTLIPLVLLGFTGCTDEKEPVIPEAAMSRVVLQEADLEGFSQFDFRVQAAADAPAGRRSDPERFGRKGGWVARYKRADTRATDGPLVIESRVDLFTDSEGATEDLAAYEAEFELLGRAPGGDLLSVKTIGEETLAATFTRGSGATTLRFFVIAWRHANVTAYLNVQGFAGNLTEDQVLDLARAQQARMARETREAA